MTILYLNVIAIYNTVMWGWAVNSLFSDIHGEVGITWNLAL